MSENLTIGGSIMKNIIAEIKNRAKQLTIDISLIGDVTKKNQLHRDSLELLLAVHDLDNTFKQTIHGSQSYFVKKKSSPSQTDAVDQDIIKYEIDKINQRLPKWAVRQHQINAKILTLFLQLEEGYANITEQLLMEKYDNQPEFYRNFIQMKVIAPKNHGKVFDVQNGIIKIWDPIKDVVEEYKKIVFGNKVKKSSPDTHLRKIAAEWMRSNHPSEPLEPLRASKYYPQQDIWFFTFPSSYFDTDKYQFLNILLQFKDDINQFYYLKVPFSFFKLNKNKFDVRNTGKKFDLHISAKRHNWLVDERSQGVDFHEFEQ